MARKLANQGNAGFFFDIVALVRCIELAPDFVKGYSRKGTLQYFMKEYDKAVATYEAGLKHDPDNAELKEGMMRCLEAIDRIAHGEPSALLLLLLLLVLLLLVLLVLLESDHPQLHVP